MTDVNRITKKAGQELSCPAFCVCVSAVADGCYLPLPSFPPLVTFFTGVQPIGLAVPFLAMCNLSSSVMWAIRW